VLTEPDLVEGGGGPRSGRTTVVVAAVVVSVLVVLAWRTSLSEDAAGQRHPAPARPVTSRSTPPVSSPPTGVEPTPSVVAMGSDPKLLAADRQGAWLDTLHGRTARPMPYGHVSGRDFRVLPSGDGTGAEDYGAIVQVRNAGGRWVDVVTGFAVGLPPVDGSGRYLAFAVGKANLTQQRIDAWVYVVSVADARVVRKLRLDTAREAVGWLGNRVILASYGGYETVQLLDWHRATPVLEDLGPGSTVLRNPAGLISLIDAGGPSGCLAVWRFTPARHGIDACPDDQILAMSPDGRQALTHDLHWVSLRSGRATPVGGRPDGVMARSASFLPDGRALIDLTLDGSSVDATVLCSRANGCRRVSARRAELLPL
jgi:hypothetical protein